LKVERIALGTFNFQPSTFNEKIVVQVNLFTTTRIETAKKLKNFR